MERAMESHSKDYWSFCDLAAGSVWAMESNGIGMELVGRLIGR